MSGSISLLIDSPLATLQQAMSGMDTAVRTQIGRQTKLHANPIWADELRGRVQTTQQARVAKTAKTSVTARQIYFLAGGTGKIGTTPVSQLFKAIEFGASPDRVIENRSRKGTHYTQRMGRRFQLPRRRGYLAYPAVSEAIPRVGKLWVQTAVRTMYEETEKVAN